ncbi:GGDEF domain-containing protein [Photobacterium atrarenae]|uniref:diguanylate cyclase n=1 Tax=Photobacterium atrarenae TaxID=865757 RepID=A0ABY5GI61_9GAMM|nr:GGDEF domain-containing protein [Photobacterium atrarenae]UTV28814.1 GGDEF domain-containing protein [Photobacterium atrarenae]
MRFDAFDGTQTLRARVLGGLCITLGVLAALMAILNIYWSQSYFIGFLEGIFAALSYSLYVKAKRQTYTLREKNYYLLFLFVLVTYAIYSKPLSMGVYVWAFLLPTIFYLLLGKKQGLVVSLVSLVAQNINIALKQPAADMIQSIPVMVNFSFCYLSILGVSHVYESNRNKVEQALHELALTDALTGAKNRLAFKKDRSTQHQQGKVLSVLVLDIDHFKAINDTYGHEVGDDVLKIVTQRIMAVAGEGTVYRQGGEEFCVLLNCPLLEAASVAEGIRANIDEADFVSQGTTIHVTVSLGVAEFEFGQSEDDVLRLADERLYTAKTKGRNQVVASHDVSLAS